jgi:hypothetical protein
MYNGSPFVIFSPVRTVSYIVVPALPVSTLTLNVLASPFVKVIVEPAADAVTNEDAVTDELTKPNAVICADELTVPVGIAPLPLTSGITTPNVDESPFVNVKVFPAKDAVVKPKLAEVNKDDVAEFILVIDVFTLALFASKEVTLWSFDCVYALNEEVVTKLPVLIVLPLTSGITTPNVDASPLVNVNVLPLKDAVTNELAVIADVTYDDVAAFKAFIDV